MRQRYYFVIPIALIVIVGVLAGAGPAGAAKAPIGKTYYVISLGLGQDGLEAYEAGAGCLHFTRQEVCVVDGDCGAWWSVTETDPAPRQWEFGFNFDVIDDESGLPLDIEGSGRIDSRGPKSSIAMAARAFEPNSGVKLNFAIAGRAVGAARCERLVADFMSGR